MSRNLGRQAHRAQQNTTHRKLDDDIADTRSLLNTSTQAMKDLKTQLKELTDKKKEAGKAPWNNQAVSNKFDVPILKIRAGSATTNAEFELTPGSPTPNEDVEMQEIMPIDLPFEIGTPSNDSEEARYSVWRSGPVRSLGLKGHGPRPRPVFTGSKTTKDRTEPM